MINIDKLIEENFLNKQYCDVYIYDQKIHINDITDLMRRKVFNSDENIEGYLIFINPCNIANWSHECWYWFIHNNEIIKNNKCVWPPNSNIKIKEYNKGDNYMSKLVESYVGDELPPLDGIYVPIKSKNNFKQLFRVKEEYIKEVSIIDDYSIGKAYIEGYVFVKHNNNISIIITDNGEIKSEIISADVVKRDGSVKQYR